MPRRLAVLFAAAVLQLVALVLAHELVFLARYGSRFGEALAHSGHGETWGAAATTSLALGAGLAAIAVFQLARLGLLVRRSRTRPSENESDLKAGNLLRAWLRVGPRVALLSVGLLTVQENIERAATGVAVPGPAILLTPEYSGGLWITIAVGLTVGLVAALFTWRRSVLLARLRAARAALPRGTDRNVSRPRLEPVRPVESLLGRRSALRAPPAVVAT